MLQGRHIRIVGLPLMDGWNQTAGEGQNVQLLVGSHTLGEKDGRAKKNNALYTCPQLLGAALED